MIDSVQEAYYTLSYQFPPDIEALVNQQLATGYFESPDHVLRAALEQLAAQEMEAQAIQASIDLVDAGDEGVSLDEAFTTIRTKYDISSDS